MGYPAALILESGKIFRGETPFPVESAGGEVVFNTALSGYQEIVTDPSYCGQIVVMTYPHIGNYGVIPGDSESDRIWVSGLVVRELSGIYSNWQATRSLLDYFQEWQVSILSGIDTRALTRHIREYGALRGFFSSRNLNLDYLRQEVAKVRPILGRNLVSAVTIDEPKEWKDNPASPRFRVVVIDCGVKYNILRSLVWRNCRVIRVPATTAASEILQLRPDGVLISNGPGDPNPLSGIIKTVGELIAYSREHFLPLFGICLGHQFLALASGGKIYKLPFGHHGANHPVKDLRSGKVEITSQNHNFCVDMDSLSHTDFELTHQNLYDGTAEGMAHRKLPIFSMQYHPEAAAGPHDTIYLFDRFCDLLEKHYAPA